MDPLDGIAAFARVASTGSFSAAANSLKISKSAVSAHVQRLEQRLGVRLLHRTTRKLSLTEAGAAYYSHCARILSDAEAAEQAAHALQSEPRGTLRISVPDSFGSRHIAPVLPAFLKRFPELAVELSLSHQHVDLVAENLDLAIRIGVLKDSSLVVRRLAVSNLVVCASRAYLAERKPPREPRDLAGHNCLIPTVLPWAEEWRFTGKTGNVNVPVRGNVRSNNADALRVAALEGQGIALLPSWTVADDLRAGHLRRLLADWELPASAIHAAYPDNRLMSPKVKAFVDHLAKHIGRTPYWDKNI